jgi:hypothetical protein
MKSFIIIASFLFLAFESCGTGDTNKNTNAAKAASDSANYTTIQWIDSTKDVGTINFGEKAEIKFRFKNSGDKPLLVVSAQPSCGCTVADYPKQPIAPGEEGVITAGFDSKKGSVGEFRKNIVVTTNTKGSTSTVLYFNGVIKKEGSQDVGLPTPVSVDTTAH